MKTKIYFFLLIFTIGIISCGHETKINSPEKDSGYFQFKAKQKENSSEYKITIISSRLPGNRAFAYVDYCLAQGSDVMVCQLRFCFTDTVTITTELNHALKIYQFEQREDSTGTGLQCVETIPIQKFFEINGLDYTLLG